MCWRQTLNKSLGKHTLYPTVVLWRKPNQEEAQCVPGGREASLGRAPVCACRKGAEARPTSVCRKGSGGQNGSAKAPRQPRAQRGGGALERAERELRRQRGQCGPRGFLGDTEATAQRRVATCLFSSDTQISEDSGHCLRLHPAPSRGCPDVRIRGAAGNGATQQGQRREIMTEAKYRTTKCSHGTGRHVGAWPGLKGGESRPLLPCDVPGQMVSGEGRRGEPCRPHAGPELRGEHAGLPTRIQALAALAGHVHQISDSPTAQPAVHADTAAPPPGPPAAGGDTALRRPPPLSARRAHSSLQTGRE